jgi:hypothetical protein
MTFLNEVINGKKPIEEEIFEAMLKPEQLVKKMVIILLIVQ